MRRIRCVLLTLLLPLLMLATAPASLRAQWTGRGPAPSSPRSPEQRGTEKSPTTARLIGIVPGAGHFYADEPGRGLAFAGGAVGVLLLGGLLMAGECVAEISTVNGDEECGSTAIESVTAVAFVGVWGWSIYDAGLAARRTNARHGYRATAFVAPLAAYRTGAGAGRRFGIGLSIAPR